MYWCQLLVDCSNVFISCLDSHSDGTHSLQRIHWWASDAMIHFSKSVLIKNKLICILNDLRGSTFSFFKCHIWVNYSFKFPKNTNSWAIKSCSGWRSLTGHWMFWQVQPETDVEYGSDDQQRGKLQYSLEFNASTSEVIILFTDFKSVPPTGRKYNYIYIYIYIWRQPI